MNPLIEQLHSLLADTKRRFEIPETDRDALRQEVLGRKGVLADLFSRLAALSPEQRAEAGRVANEIKQQLEGLFGDQKKLVLSQDQLDDARTWTASRTSDVGHAHPLSLFLEKALSIFSSLGYDIVDSPELEDEEHNFDLLNIPADHPARDEWDTFFVKAGKRKHGILRTHTSPMQIRTMKSRKPPVRIVVPGRVYRHEALDASHAAAFYQCEGFLIDKGISLRHLMGTLDAFLKSLFGREIEVRFRPHYYPFVEPGMDVDMKWNGKWLEVLGSGMIHPTVLQHMNVDSEEWSGFAFGLGIDRLAMLYWGIPDIRLLYGGDKEFGSQFS